MLSGGFEVFLWRLQGKQDLVISGGFEVFLWRLQGRQELDGEIHINACIRACAAVGKGAAARCAVVRPLGKLPAPAGSANHFRPQAKACRVWGGMANKRPAICMQMFEICKPIYKSITKMHRPLHLSSGFS